MTDEEWPDGVVPSFLTGGGQAGALVRALDWANTPVGPVSTWPASLRTAVGIILNSRHPMFLWWGPDLVQFYNDAYIPGFGNGKHPAAMGQRGAECWQESWPVVSPQIEAVMQRGQSSWHEDRLVPIIRNGCLEEVYWTYGYSPVFDDHGGIGGTLVVCTETPRHVARAARAADAEALTAAAAERDALLQQLERASRAKDEFLAMLGHELRNPLSPILTALQLMRMRGERRADREREIIERQVQHLVTLVDDLLDISRITQGKVELKRERLRVADVIAKAIEMASPLIEQRRHHLTVGVPDDLLVDADGARLAQVVANLLTNAAKYTEPEGDIAVHAELRYGEAWIAVRDSGVGIAPELLPHVFDAFTQERQTSARSKGGLGLGLAIVKSLVGMHDGTITLYSKGVGHGTESLVRLPLAHGETREAPAVVATAGIEAPAEGREVLVVDDNEDAAETLVLALRTLGHRVQVALDAPAALTLASDYVPDVALLDLGLPVIDGCELAQRLRHQPGWREVRLIALTGYGLESDRQRTRQAGFDAHLVKPIDLRTLNAELMPGGDTDAQGASRR